MVKLYDGGVYLVNGTEIVEDNHDAEAILKQKMGDGVPSKAEAAKNTIAYNILQEHNTSGNMDKLKIKFDKLTSHDITFRNHSDSKSVRTGEIPDPLCTDKLP